jgi:hypothetical protein
MMARKFSAVNALENSLQSVSWKEYMAKFPLSDELDALHDAAMFYSCAVQNQIAARGGCKSLSSEALNVLTNNAILMHRSVRTLCEAGWAPAASILNRTLLDIAGSCLAVCHVPELADYMGFKYFSHYYLKLLAEPDTPQPERDNANRALDMLVKALNPEHQTKAQEVRAKTKPTVFWFQPEHVSIKAILTLAQQDVYRMFQMLSGPTHGGFEMKMILNDDPRSEDIEPREHPKNVPRQIAASSRLLVEGCYVRDNWDNANTNQDKYNAFLASIQQVRT